MLKPERFVSSVIGVLLPLVIASAKLQNAALSPHGQITQAPCGRRSGSARRLRFSPQYAQSTMSGFTAARALSRRKN